MSTPEGLTPDQEEAYKTAVAGAALNAAGTELEFRVDILNKCAVASSACLPPISTLHAGTEAQGMEKHSGPRKCPHIHNLFACMSVRSRGVAQWQSVAASPPHACPQPHAAYIFGGGHAVARVVTKGRAGTSGDVDPAHGRRASSPTEPAGHSSGC
eukprot:364059-Chlamydomonas_euryale.AAC.10